MKYATELAPNLFNSYDSWLENYRYMLARDPTHDELRDAELYFCKKEKEVNYEYANLRR